MTTRVTEGARRERHWRGFFLVGLPLDACARVHSPALNLKKKTDCSQSTAVMKSSDDEASIEDPSVISI